MQPGNAAVFPENESNEDKAVALLWMGGSWKRMRWRMALPTFLKGERGQASEMRAAPDDKDDNDDDQYDEDARSGEKQEEYVRL
jgi:hypothetical protein